MIALRGLGKMDEARKEVNALLAMYPRYPFSSALENLRRGGF